MLLISLGFVRATTDGLIVTLAGRQRILQDLQEPSVPWDDDEPELEAMRVADELIQFTGLRKVHEMAMA